MEITSNLAAIAYIGGFGLVLIGGHYARTNAAITGLVLMLVGMVTGIVTYAVDRDNYGIIAQCVFGFALFFTIGTLAFMTAGWFIKLIWQQVVVRGFRWIFRRDRG